MTLLLLNTFDQQKKLHREARTIDAMIKLHCRQKHRCESLCEECLELQQFCYLRLSRCPYGEKKPTCQSCTIHCYRGAKDLRAEVRDIMRQVGPKMLWHHPFLALQHLADKRIKAEKKQNTA